MADARAQTRARPQQGHLRARSNFFHGSVIVLAKPLALISAVLRLPLLQFSNEDRVLGDAVVEAAVAGDPAAIGAVLRELAPEVARVVRAILGPNDMGVEDAIQDGLLSLMHALPSFRRDCSLRRYANRIAARTALHARHRSRAARQREEHFGQEVRPHAYIDGQHELTLRRKAFVHRLFDVLPEAQAEVLALRFLLGYSLDEIAQAVGAPLNTVRSRIRLAKEVMRAHLEDDPELLEHLPGRP